MTFSAFRLRLELSVSSFLRFDDHVSGLLHKGILSDLAEETRQKSFIFLQLSISFVACAIAPFYLTFQGAPAPWQTLTFIFAMMPLVSAALVWRTGKLFVAQSLTSFSFIAIATTLALGSGDAHQTVLTWLILAPLQSVLTADKRLILVTGFAAALAALMLVIGHKAGFVSAEFSVGNTLFLLIPAIFYATALCLGTAQIDALQHLTARLNASRYQAISDVIGDVILCFDQTGGAEFVSLDCNARLGLSRQDLLGRGFFEHIHVADRPQFLKAVADATRSSERSSIVLRFRTLPSDWQETQIASPNFLWIELHLRPYLDTQAGSHGKTETFIVAILHDVTKAKQHEEELEAARATAERLNQSRDHFLANMSHELRTPLNAIIGFAEMLSSKELVPADPEKRQEYAEIIRHSGLHLLSVVNSILDMSKLQSGSFDLLPEPFEIAPVVDLCCDMVKLKANEGNVELTRAYSRDIAELIGDKQACQQIILNLLSNAVKFTPRHGRVVINVRSEGNSSLIQITDTGIGIGPSDLAKLGNPFFQASGSYNRAYEGTGLGLSIVRGLVGLHGGTIAIESELGKGTSVTVRLPRDCRQVRVKQTASAEITTIPRRTRLDEMRTFSNEMMVKKIA
jgi:cell cycle sensor histidine kinase DivJ